MENNSWKILIVDDDHRNIFALEAVLKSRGYQCCVAQSVEESIPFLREDARIGIVLVDMMMPGTDGYTGIPILKKTTGNKIPMIAITAQAMPGDREKCLAAGADDYLSKPLDVDQLFQKLQQHLTVAHGGD